MMKRLLLLLCCCLTAFSAAAQDATPEPNQGYILNAGAEIFFPQAVRFEVNSALGVPDLASAVLVVQPADRLSIPINVNVLDAAILKTPYARLSYIWQLPRENPPHLFKDIFYTWRLTSKTGETAEFSGKILFADTRVQWVTFTDELKQINLTLPMVETDRRIQEVLPAGPQIQPTLQATLSVPRVAVTSAAATGLPLSGSTPRASVGNIEPNFVSTASVPTPASKVVMDAKSVALLRQQLQPVYDQLVSHTEGKPSFNFLVYTDAFTPGCNLNSKGEPIAIGVESGTSIACDPVLAAIVLQGSGYDVVQGGTTTIGSLIQPLTEYMVRQFYAPLWAGKNVPNWFVVGLAQFYTPSTKTPWLPGLLTAARSDRLLPMTAMAAPPGADPNLWMAQSYGMTLYLADQLTVPGLFTLARDIGSSASFDEAYQTALGTPSTALLADFSTWLFSDRAVGAFTISAYQAATATPTATLTATASSTSTATVTPTVTLTPTVTGTLSPTPPQKQIATQTPTSIASPSITPRAMSDLFTPTPTVTPVPPSDPLSPSAPTGRSVLIALAVLVVVAILVVLIRFRDRP